MLFIYGKIDEAGEVYGLAGARLFAGILIPSGNGSGAALSAPEISAYIQTPRDAFFFCPSLFWNFSVSFFVLDAEENGKYLADPVVYAIDSGDRLFLSALFVWNGDKSAGNFPDRRPMPVSVHSAWEIGKNPG